MPITLDAFVDFDGKLKFNNLDQADDQVIATPERIAQIKTAEYIGHQDLGPSEAEILLSLVTLRLDDGTVVTIDDDDYALVKAKL